MNYFQILISYKQVNKYYDQFCTKYSIEEINPKKQYGRHKTTFAIYLSQKGLISPRIYYHDKYIKDSKGMTVEDYLIKQNIKVPKFWQINYNDSSDDTDDIDTYTDDTSEYSEITSYSQSNQDFDQNIKQKKKNGKNDKKKNKNDRDQQLMDNIDLMLQQYKYQYQDDYEKLLDFVYQFCIKCKIMDIEVFKNNSSIVDNNDNKQTLSIYLASNGVIPPEIFNHDKYIRDSYKKTVEEYLIENNMQVPEQWQNSGKIDFYVLNQLHKYCKKYNIDKEIIINNSSWQDNENKETFAIYLAYKGILPPKQFEHDSKLQNIEKCTVAMKLAQNKMIPPNQWQHEPSIQNRNGFTVSMLLSLNGIIPQYQWYHQSDLQNDYGNTVAIYLAMNGITPQKEWSHYSNLKNNDFFTVEDYLKQNNQNILDYWKTNKKQVQLEQKIEKMLKQYAQNYNTDINYIISNPHWQDNDFKKTFAMYLIQHEQISISNIFEHNPLLQDKNGHTVAVYLESKNIKTLQQWRYDILYKLKNNSTTAMQIAYCGVVPSNYWNHDPTIYNNYGETVAIILETKGIETPAQWRYYQQYRIQENKQTTAMKIAQNKKIPSQFWNHDPNLTDDKDKRTVAMYLAISGIIPPKQWQHDPKLKDKDGKTVQDYLKQKDIKIPCEWQQ